MTHSLEEIQDLVKSWLRNLEKERKCNTTNQVQKLVSGCDPDVQDEIRNILVLEIEKLLEKSSSSGNLIELQRVCSTINGCFDNFMHAIDAVRRLFSEVLSFIVHSLDECEEAKKYSRPWQKNTVLELLHSLSRVLILVLKLKRTQNSGRERYHSYRRDCGIEDLPDKEKCKYLLAKITQRIGRFLLMDEILIDTKNNLSMAGVLIREILISNLDQLIQFEKSFSQSLLEPVADEKSKVNILKLLMSSAIINTWSSNIIGRDSVQTYIRFLISLCEKYSCETPIVLNTSRTLLLLIKHDSFIQFVNLAPMEDVEKITIRLFFCILMLLEHPVPCVRNSAKDFFQNLATQPILHPFMIEEVFKLPTDKRSYYISLGALAKAIGSESLIKSNPELPRNLIAALCDPTIVSHVSLAVEYMISNDGQEGIDFAAWNETWIVPLLNLVMSAPPIVAADIEKLLGKSFRYNPESVVYVIKKWANPVTKQDLHCILTALKISQKHGFQLQNSKQEENVKEGGDIGVALLGGNLLEHCLHQRDDDFRISAFSLIIDSHRTTKPFSDRDFKMVLYFLKYNLNNEQASTRQKILGMIRKMFSRFSDARNILLKPAEDDLLDAHRVQCYLLYEKFLSSLFAFCFSNIFLGCNFNSRSMSELYWSKFLIALDSSYEENKQLAVILAQKLDLSSLEANKPLPAKSLFEKAFDLCTHMEPPDVLTGAYLLQVLQKLPSAKQVLSSYFVDEPVLDDVSYCCIQVLVRKLKEQIQLAKLNLMTAATCGPMYGALFAIRLIFHTVDFTEVVDSFEAGSSIFIEWGRVLQEVVDLCFEVTRIVGCVVNSSSPEGHLPMDFQTNFENLLSQTLDEKCNLKGSGDFNGTSERDERKELVKTACRSFFNKFQGLESRVKSVDFDAYESLRVLNCLVKENELLTQEVEGMEEASSDERELLEQLTDVKVKLEEHGKNLREMSAVTEWPATAQVLLLCAWRSLKEASLFLGDLVSKLPIETSLVLGLVSRGTVIRIGEEMKVLLCEIKHRGAFEQAYIGFTQLVKALWKCPDRDLSELPRRWLDDIMSQLKTPLKEQKVKLCSTRRSAGLPFLVQAIICSEITSIRTTPSSLHSTMNVLLRITESGVEQNPEAKIHALNVLRALFKHAQLGEHVSSYVSKALMVAIRGSRAESWSERNSSSLLFSALMIRIFGVSRSRDEVSKKNRMTSRTFFQRYSDLYDFLLSEMELVYSVENHVDGLYPKPSLYLVLLILGRLYPPPAEDLNKINLSEFLPYINMSRKNPTMKIRELGAKALLPLVPFDRLLDELDSRFSELSFGARLSNNERHGILLQVKTLLSQPRVTFEKFRKEKREIGWVEKSKWMLDCVPRIPFVILSTYVSVLHALFKNFPGSREKISELITGLSVAEELQRLPSSEQSLLPGIFVFLERFYFLKADVLGQSDGDNEREAFFKFLLSSLHSQVSDVQSVSLRILREILKFGCDFDFDFDSDYDDFSGVTVPVKNLLLFESGKNIELLYSKTVNSKELLKCLTERVNALGSEVPTSTVIKRIWLDIVSTLVLKKVIPMSSGSDPADDADFSFNVDVAKALIKAEDKDLSSSAAVCYGLYLMKEISKEAASTEDRLLLSDTLHEFSHCDADVRERLAVAKILSNSCGNFFQKNTVTDPVMMNVWMIPLRLIADENTVVRDTASEIVCRMQAYILEEVFFEDLTMEMTTVDWPQLPVVPLKAQEYLIESYINILGRENLVYLLAQLFITAMPSLEDLDDPDNFSKDEFGVFDKGNPNPYCEDLAITHVICDKIKELKALVEFEVLMRKNLDKTLAAFIADRFYLKDRVPGNLREVVEVVTDVIEECGGFRGEFSFAGVAIRKLKDNVWERKTKWILLEKGDYHYKKRLLLKHFNRWLVYLRGRHEEKWKREAAEGFREKKLKWKGLKALMRNAEEARVSMRLYGRKFEWGLKYKCWHHWKHYTQKRVKVREIKVLADRIREEKLRIRCFYLWTFRLREKRLLQDAYRRAEEMHSMKLKEKYFAVWRVFREKRAWEVKIGALADTCYEDKLKERFIGCWRRYTFQRKRYKYQMKVIDEFYESYLLKNYVNVWLEAYKRLKRERKVRRHSLAMELHDRKLLRRSFRMLWEVRERKREEEEKMNRFREIHSSVVVRFYLNSWLERCREKVVSDILEKKARLWREDYLREVLLRKLSKKYEERLEEKEEMAKVVKYSEAMILQRAFRGWLGVTERKVWRRAQLEDAARFYFERITRKTLLSWKEFKAMRDRKKMAVEFYGNALLSRAMGEWKSFLAEQRKKQAEARNLEKRVSTKLIRNAFDFWRNEVRNSSSKLTVAVGFHEKAKLSKAFRVWKERARVKAVYRSRYNRNQEILNEMVMKDVIFRWYEMLSVKVRLERTLEGLRWRREKRAVAFHFGAWRRFVQKMKCVEQSTRAYPQVRWSLLVEEYLVLMVEAVRSRRSQRRKDELARRAEENMLKRRYFSKWLCFICWKRERILKCLREDRESRRPFELAVPAAKSVRRQPVIPDFLKIGHHEESFKDSLNQETFRVIEAVDTTIPVISERDSFAFSDT